MSWLGLTLAILAVLLVAALLLRKVCPVLSKVLAIMLAVYAVIMIVGTAVFWNVKSSSEAEADFAVVLGYALQDGEASEELVDRLELAVEWLNATEKIPLIVTGGDPGGQGVTEASVMAQWLQQHGADMTRVHIEDRARDTRENFLLSMEQVCELGMDADTVGGIKRISGVIRTLYHVPYCHDHHGGFVLLLFGISVYFCREVASENIGLPGGRGSSASRSVCVCGSGL